MTREEFIRALYDLEADVAVKKAIDAVWGLSEEDLVERYRFCRECGFERFTLEELGQVLPDQESAMDVLRALFEFRSGGMDRGMNA